FIDRVANYRQYDENGNAIQGKIGKWFEEIYTEISQRPKYKDLLPYAIEEIHDGYFSLDNKKKFKDSSGKTKADDDTYKLIMKDKERLLDISEPLRFIFSHSALREGWDNPNVFQICTLNETKSELKKRQEIGRGLRLAVDQTGNRIHDKSINVLTVIANESYDDFANTLQKEIEDDCGVVFDKSRIKNRDSRVPVKYRKGFEADPKFLEIWNRINKKTTYRVNYDTADLIKTSAKSIKEMLPITRPSIRSIKVGIDISKQGVDTHLVSEKKYNYKASKPDLPDVLANIQGKTQLTRSTIARILSDSTRINDVFINPQLFFDQTVKYINRNKFELMIDGIKYERVQGKDYEMKLFTDKEIEVFRSKDDYDLHKPDKTIYSDFIPLDSKIESKFAKDCEDSHQIEFYFKLPNWFKIDTPIGGYNPDWALIFKNETKIYFVAETKSTLESDELRKKEVLKIKCGTAHFEEFEDVEYKQVRKVEDLI
ncbi:MAG: DEAD/DEAH box helicase, partial [Chlorobi bacterium]|nr:DEAD/DEAH box helicase [Chlorobiota bacterium]